MVSIMVYKRYLRKVMKIKEILSEAPNKEPLRKSIQNAIPNLSAYSQLDNNNHPYLSYRFGIALAGSPDEEMPVHGPIGSQFIISDYTDGDNVIRQAAEKNMGMKHQTLSSKGSSELDIINKTSPIAPKKKNKYGV